MSPPRLRVLLSAYYCSPYRGSESAVGWQTAAGLAKYHDVTVLFGDLSAAAPGARDIERYRKETGLPDNLELVHVQAEGAARIVNRLHALPGLWFLYYEAYRRWQRQVLDVARRMHAERPFDLVHHVTVIGFREPGYLWQLGIPFFWGPVSGTTEVPPAFVKDFGAKERFRWTTHRLINRMQTRRGGRPGRAALAAAKIWAVCKEDARVLQGWGGGPDLMPEVGCVPVEGVVPRSRAEEEPRRLCWSGMFQGRKALPLLLRAIAKVGSRDIRLHVLGGGAEAERWHREALSLGIGQCVEWHGMLPREDALKIFDRTHVFIHTSVKEATSTVILEALERGIPVVCHDACGMGTAVNESCGIRIPLEDPGMSVDGFADAIGRFLRDPALLPTLSAGAIVRARELSWESKVERISAAYLHLLGKAPGSRLRP